MNDLWLETKYLNLLSPMLPRFRKKNDRAWQFRCVLCGDSKKSKIKARGGCYVHKGVLMFHCFNCSVTTSFQKFLKNINPQLYKEFVMELMKSRAKPSSNTAVQEAYDKVSMKPTFNVGGLLDELMDRVDTLPANHIAVKYCERRKFPHSVWHKLYFIDDCTKVSKIKLKRREDLHNEPRLVFPVYNMRNQLCAMQMRDVTDNPKLLPWVLAKFIEDEILIYNIEDVDWTKDVLVFEGTPDAVMFDNAVAVLTSSLTQKLEQLLIYKSDMINNCVFVFDNDPRNKEVVAQVRKAVEKGYRTVIWPENFSHSDPNDAVVKGKMPFFEVTDIVNNNVFSGLTLRHEFVRWKKV